LKFTVTGFDLLPAVSVRSRRNTIALWLGHATVKSTEIYLHADTEFRHEAIQRAAPIGTRPGRYRPPDTLLAFLEEL
jgi:hypothetical protein